MLTRPRRPGCAHPDGGAASAAPARLGCAPCRPAAPDGSPADGGTGRSSRSPPSTPVRTHPGWHDETQRAPGEEEIGLWRDDLHPENPRPLLEAWPRPATTPIKPSKLVREPHCVRGVEGGIASARCR